MRSSEPDSKADREHVAELEAEHAAEERWSVAERLVAVTAGTAGIGALAGPAGAAVGAVVGGLLGIFLAATRSRRVVGSD